MTIQSSTVLLLAALASALPLRVAAAGIPEPSFTLYGAVFNQVGATTVRMTAGEIRWTFKPLNGGSWVTITNQLSNINDQFSYVVQIPCESEIAGFAISPGALKVPTNPAWLDCATVSINNQPVTFVNAAHSQLLMGANERGRLQRVDLNVGIVVVDGDGDGLPDGWEQLHFGGLNQTADGDADGDGVSNLAEYRAGTHPDDPNSLFELIRIVPQAQGALIEWSSVAGRFYKILRSNQLTTGFAAIASQLPATAPINSFLDSSATNGANYFYRLQLEQ